MKKDTMSKVIGAILLVVSVVAYVVLALTDKNNSIQGLVLFVSPVITWLLMRDKIDNIKDNTDQIQKQTNGLLTNKFNEVATLAAQKAVEKDTNNG